MDTTNAPADAGMTWFEVYDTPQAIAAAYPIVATVSEPEPVRTGDDAGSTSYRARGIRFRSDTELDAFRARYPTFSVTKYIDASGAA